MKLYYARIADIDTKTLFRLSDPETRERAEACLRNGRGEEIALGRYLARFALAQAEGLDIAKVRLQHDDAGRPFFPEGNVFVSISRSDGLAAAMVQHAKAVCDLQAIRRFPGAAVRGFFSAAEYAQIRASAEPDREMTRLFSRRECLVKWLGRRPKEEGWDAEAERLRAALSAVFTETELEGRLLCVLGPAETVTVTRVKEIGG